jgi:hypothetical protein
MIAAAAVVLVAFGCAEPTGATPANFVIEFTQISAPPSAGAPPAGHFTVDDTLLNTGLDEFVHITTIPDFEVVDGTAIFPSSIWFGFLHIPAFGLDLHIQGLPSDDPGSNAVAELLLPSNDPTCFDVAVAVPTHCQFALGSHPGGVRSWAEVFFDSNSNLAVATGSYSVLPASLPVSEPGTVVLLGAGILGLIATVRKRTRRDPL